MSAPTNEFIITFKKGKQAFEDYFLNTSEPVKERGRGPGALYWIIATANFILNVHLL